MVDIFNYLDYRRFLRDLVKELKAKQQYNVRTFARKAEIRTPGYMKMVIDGKRNLTAETADKFCRALDITDQERKYFEYLVLYNQTTDPDLKKDYLEELLALCPRSAQYKMEKNQYRYFSRPHYITIYEMVALPDFQEDYKWIAKRCFPPVRTSEAKEAIDSLLKLELLKRDENGKLYQTQKVIHTGDKNTKIAETYHYHEAVLNLARHALGSLKQEDRHYNSLTLPLSQKKFLKIIDKFYSLQNEILQELEAPEADANEIYQINFQLYPVTKKDGTS